MSLTPLGLLRLSARPAWARRVREAMQASGGRIPDAAEALEVSMRTLFRWLDEPDLADVPRVANGAKRQAKDA